MNKGFTLIELLVAILIVGILSAVAVSSYQDYILRGRRADAKSVLLQVAGFLERNYTVAGSYSKDSAGADITVPTSLAQSPQTGTARYNISFTAGEPTQTTFKIQAVPVSADALCGTLTLDQLGTQGMSGTYSGTVADCWQH